MKKLIVALVFVISMAIIPMQSQAASSLQVIFEDTLWGALIGTVAGAATMAFMDEPSDHYERMAQGASIGSLCGMGFGAYEISPVLFTIRKDSNDEIAYGVNFSIPLN